MDGEAHYRRSSEARTVGGVQRDATQGRKPEKPWKSRSFTNFGRGVFYTQHQSPYFRVRVSDEEIKEKFSRPKLPPSISILDGCQIFWRLARWCRSLFKSKRSEKIFSDFPLGCGSRYGAIIILSAVSHFQPSAMVSGTHGECRSARGDPQSLLHRALLPI